MLTCSKKIKNCFNPRESVEKRYKGLHLTLSSDREEKDSLICIGIKTISFNFQYLIMPEPSHGATALGFQTLPISIDQYPSTVWSATLLRPRQPIPMGKEMSMIKNQSCSALAVKNVMVKAVRTSATTSKIQQTALVSLLSIQQTWNGKLGLMDAHFATQACEKQSNHPSALKLG